MRATDISMVLVLTLTGCATVQATRTNDATTQPVVADGIVSGEIENVVQGTPMVSESFTDDGETLRSSDSTRNGFASTCEYTRRPAHVHASTVDGHSFDFDVPAGTIALPENHWQFFAIAADRYAQATEATPVHVLNPLSTSPMSEALILVQPAADGTRTVTLTQHTDAGNVDTVATISGEGVVTSVRFPDPNTIVRTGTGVIQPPNAQ